jgi:threonine dehydratase
VARVLLVSDDAIRAAQQRLWESVRIVAEPGGAAALAALLSGAYVPAAGERVGVVLSGGNTTAVDFAR